MARGPVARLVAAGGRNSHEWTPEKHSLLQHYDESGITAAFLDPEDRRVYRRAKESGAGADRV